MSLDLTKLSPAPWEWNGSWRVCHSAESRIGVVCDTATNNNSRTWENQANAAFIALARNAFDIQMRRGWGVILTPEGWTISLEGAFAGSQKLRDAGWRGWFTDPFTALVEADKWLANVEEANAAE